LLLLLLLLFIWKINPMKYYLIFFCIIIMISLMSAGFFLIKGKKNSNMAWALTWRIGLSLFLFTSIWLLYLLGWIQPTGIPYK
jgi:Protein of unknown function (DUF2909)